MKTINILITGLIAITFFAPLAFAQEDRTSNKILLYLPSSVYKQTPIEDAKRMKNYSPADQYQTSVAPDDPSNIQKTEQQKEN